MPRKIAWICLWVWTILFFVWLKYDWHVVPITNYWYGVEILLLSLGTLAMVVWCAWLLIKGVTNG